MALRQWVTAAQLQARIGASLYTRLFDDTGDGTVEAVNVTQAIEDASALVAGYLRGTYELAAVDTAVTAGTCGEVVRLTLDAIEMMACKRHPEVALHKDWTALDTALRAELRALRKGDTRLDVEGSPEPAANQGGAWGEGDPTVFDEDTYVPVFVHGFGDF